MVPTVSVAHWVVWVRAFAVWSSSRLAMLGRMAARPLVKNGDANISKPLSAKSSHVRGASTAATNASATTARSRSLAIITRRRSRRSSTTPATGPARMAGTARASMTPLTTSPDPLVCITRLNTAMLLK